MNSCVCPLAILRTMCWSQTFWKSVEGIGESYYGLGVRGAAVVDSSLGARRSAVGGRNAFCVGSCERAQTLEERLARCGLCDLSFGRRTQFLRREDRMAKIKSFRELDVWNSSMSLALLCYEVTASFPRSELYGLTAQLRRAAASVPANIAEGHNRRSHRAYLNHTNIALGSLAELDSLLELAHRLNFISEAVVRRLRPDLDRTGQMLHGLSRSLERGVFES
jgi:four helix bundle protein